MPLAYEASELIALHNHVEELTTYGGNPDRFRGFHVVQYAVGNIYIVSVRQEQIVKSCLGAVSSARVLAGFDLKGNSQCSLLFSIFHGHLYRGIDVALKAVHWGPDVFLNIEKFVDTHRRRRAIASFDDCFRLVPISMNQLLPTVKSHTPLVEMKQKPPPMTAVQTSYFADTPLLEEPGA
jgi:hypothetical protein